MKQNIKSAIIRIAAVFIAAALFILITPRLTTAYTMTVVNTSLLYFIAALGLTIMLGMGGLISFASVPFMGIGAFLSAQLSKNYSVPTAAAVPIAVIIVAVVAFLLGLVLLKLKGPYFAFATIGFAQIMSNIFKSFKPLSGGGDGISGVPKLDLGFVVLTDLYKWFYFLVIVSIICGMIVYRIQKSYLGRALASVRDDETTAKTLGINVYMTKVIAFVLSAALAALSGALLAHHNGYISDGLFIFDTSINLITIVILGGAASAPGAFLGALIVTLLPEALRALQIYMKLIYGCGVVLLVVFMPSGLVGLMKTISNRISLKLLKKKEVMSDGESKTNS